ncbi:MAG: hypothetical protein ABSH19_00205, partial [Opitutales bacterium]
MPVVTAPSQRCIPPLCWLWPCLLAAWATPCEGSCFLPSRGARNAQLGKKSSYGGGSLLGINWLNDDVDRYHTVDTWLGSGFGGYYIQDDLNPANFTGNLDSDLDYIPGTRDLEDHARLWLTIGGLQSAISNGTIAVGLKWVPFGNATFNGTNNPGIKIFPAVESDGGTLYLTDNTTANNQASGNYAFALESADDGHTLIQPGIDEGNWDYVFNKSVFANLTTTNSTVHLLFEGCTNGNGTLSLVFLQNNGGNYTVLGSGPGVAMQLQDIKEMYERWTVGDGHSGVTETAGSMTLPASSAQ